MRAGDALADGLSPAQTERLNGAIRLAEGASGLTFSIYLGAAGADSRAYAIGLHAGLADPARSVLVLCDADQRVLEIVTGQQARRVLDDVDCRLAAASMQSSFAGGDLVGGLVTGIQQLGESARHPRTLHNERLTS